MFGLFKKAPEPVPPTPVERFFAAIEELNAAWAALPGNKIKPWVDWQNREVYASTYRNPEGIDIVDAKIIMKELTV